MINSHSRILVWCEAILCSLVLLVWGRVLFRSKREKECLARFPMKNLWTRVWQTVQLFIYTQLFLAKRRAKWVYNLVAREARAQCVNRVWVLASCKLAALILTCIYPMVSAMTSYSSLKSRRIFVSRQHSTESDYDQSIHEELSFHRLQNNVYYRWISSHFSCKQNSKHKSAELSILAGANESDFG